MTTQEEVNDYLDALREMGIINMFGAAPYISDTFGVSYKEAQKYLKNWMQTFDEKRHPL